MCITCKFVSDLVLLCNCEVNLETGRDWLSFRWVNKRLIFVCMDLTEHNVVGPLAQLCFGWMQHNKLQKECDRHWNRMAELFTGSLMSKHSEIEKQQKYVDYFMYLYSFWKVSWLTNLFIFLASLSVLALNPTSSVAQTVASTILESEEVVIKKEVVVTPIENW